MSLKLTQNTSIGNEKLLSVEKHILFVLNESNKGRTAFPYAKLLINKLKRSHVEFTDLKKSPVTVRITKWWVGELCHLGKYNVNSFSKTHFAS
jgi:leucyl aminopeptidase